MGASPAFALFMICVPRGKKIVLFRFLSVPAFDWRKVDGVWPRVICVSEIPEKLGRQIGSEFMPIHDDQ